MPNPNGQPALPNPQVAYDTLFANVHAKAFFSKLASFGVQPRNDQQARYYLEMAGKLRAIEEAPQFKAANDANDPVAQANADLDAVMSRYGMAPQHKVAADQTAEIARTNMARQLAQHGDIYNSALSVKAAEASLIAQQLEAA